MPMNAPESIHWRSLLGNPYRYSIDRAMLSEDGYNISTMGRKKGMSKSSLLIPLIVNFDREYVIEKLKREVLSHLRPESYNELQKIIGEAYKEWKA